MLTRRRIGVPIDSSPHAHQRPRLDQPGEALVGNTRIQQLRKLTAERGLDPNVWFGNVEVLAAERIGAETVGYVASIFKYYVGFKLGFRKSEAAEKLKDELRNQVGHTRHREPPVSETGSRTLLATRRVSGETLA